MSPVQSLHFPASLASRWSRDCFLMGASVLQTSEYIFLTDGVPAAILHHGIIAYGLWTKMVDRPEFLVAVNKPYELFLDLEGKQLLMYLNTDFFKENILQVMLTYYY